MRYIGGKSLLLDNILEVIQDNTTDVKTVIDIFAGSGAVSKCLKENGYKVYSNDFLYFSYVLNRGTIDINKKPNFEKLGIDDPITYLNNLEIEDTDYKLKDCFIYNNYSPHDKCERMYFTTKNAIKIDIIRKKVEEWFRQGKIIEDEYFYLLSSLIAAVPCVSNITGVYGAYLKFWDKRAENDLILEEPELIKSKKKSTSYNLDCNVLLKNISADLLYADPPYLITTGSYNDGKRGFEGWSKNDDKELYQLLDKLNNKGVKFALSNVIHHKGLKNEELITWMKKYNVHYIDINYNSCNYHGKNTDKETIEVLITNY